MRQLQVAFAVLKTLQTSNSIHQVESLSINTSVDYLTSLRQATNYSDSPMFNQLLSSIKIEGWIAPEKITEIVDSLPAMNTPEAEVEGTQSFVDNVLDYLRKSDNITIHKLSADKKTFIKSSTTTNSLTSVPKQDAFKTVSFLTRKPDIAALEMNRTGSCSIVHMGEVKGRYDGDFHESDIGATIFKAELLLKLVQMYRKSFVTYLTDGYRFQFYRLIRQAREENIFHVEYSDVFTGVTGWQIFIGLFLVTLESIGYIPLSISGYTLGGCLGVGATSIVFEGRHNSSTDVNEFPLVVKVFMTPTGLADTGHCENEKSALESLYLNGVNCAPRIVEAISAQEFPMLIMRPVCSPVFLLANYSGVKCSAGHLGNFIDTLKSAHDLGRLHRDINPTQS